LFEVVVGNPSLGVIPEVCNRESKFMNSYYVYILASKKNGTLYVGVTNNLVKRVYEHKNNMVKGFTQKYGVHKLVYFEQTEDIKIAIEQEKKIKKWNRDWKIRLIKKTNPEWKDMYFDLL
jgi:putative endonuclease